MAELLLGGMLLGTVTSQMLLDFCLLTGWAWLIYSKLRPSSYGYSIPFFRIIGIEWAFLAYFIIATLSLALNAPEPIPWFYSLKKFTWIADIYLMSWLFQNSYLKAKTLLIYSLVVFFLPNLYAITGFLMGQDLVTGNGIHRAVGLVNSATYHAHGNGAIFVFFFTILLIQWPLLSWSLRTLSFISATLMSFSILFTYTRGIWLSITLSLLFLLCTMGGKILKRGLPILFATCSFLLFFAPSIKSRLTTASDGDGIRLNLYKVFWEMIKDHPLIGIGYWDQYRQIEHYWPKIGLPSDYFTSHAHNQYLNVLGTTGLLGFLFFIAIFIYFLRMNILLLKKRPAGLQRTLLLAGLITQVEYYLACVTDVTFEYAKLRAIILLVWAFLISTKSKDAQSPPLSQARHPPE